VKFENTFVLRRFTLAIIVVLSNFSSKTMRTITLELRDEAAWELERGGTELRKSVENAISTMIEQERKRRIDALIACMEDLQAEAEANGLTDEILQEILDEEE
jgi:hypothetical protein